MPFTQINPPSPSPTESKRLFYTSVSLLLSRIQGCHYHISKFHIYVLVYCIFFSFWLTSLCIVGSSFIHLIKTDSNVFFLMAEAPLWCLLKINSNYNLHPASSLATLNENNFLLKQKKNQQKTSLLVHQTCQDF